MINGIRVGRDGRIGFCWDGGACHQNFIRLGFDLLSGLLGGIWFSMLFHFYFSGERVYLLILMGIGNFVFIVRSGFFFTQMA